MASRDEALPRSSFLILLALADGPRHGLGVVEEVEARTGGEVRLGPGTLYGTLRRLEEQGLIAPAESPEDPEDRDPRRRYFGVTPRGRAALEDETRRMRALVDAAAAKLVSGQRA